MCGGCNAQWKDNKCKNILIAKPRLKKPVRDLDIRESMVMNHRVI